MNRRLGKRKRQMTGQTDQQPRSAGDAGKPSDQKEGGTTDPSTKTTSPGGKTHAPETNGKGTKSENENKHWLDYLTATFAFVAAIGGIGAGITGGYQGWVARNTEKVSSRAIVISDSIKMMTYDAPVEGQPKQPGEIGPRKWNFGAVIKNVGNTQTRNLRFHGGTDMGFPSDAEFDKLKREQTFARAFLGPHSETLAAELRFANSILGVPVGAIGVIRYQDIFEERHYSEFCFAARIPPIDFYKFPANEAIYVGGLLCGHHNCTDDECGDDWLEQAKR